MAQHDHRQWDQCVCVFREFDHGVRDLRRRLAGPARLRPSIGDRSRLGHVGAEPRPCERNDSRGLLDEFGGANGDVQGGDPGGGDSGAAEPGRSRRRPDRAGGGPGDRGKAARGRRFRWVPDRSEAIRHARPGSRAGGQRVHEERSSGGWGIAQLPGRQIIGVAGSARRPRAHRPRTPGGRCADPGHPSGKDPFRTLRDHSAVGGRERPEARRWSRREVRSATISGWSAKRLCCSEGSEARW